MEYARSRRGQTTSAAACFRAAEGGRPYREDENSLPLCRGRRLRRPVAPALGADSGRFLKRPYRRAGRAEGYGTSGRDGKLFPYARIAGFFSNLARFCASVAPEWISPARVRASFVSSGPTSS